MPQRHIPTTRDIRTAYRHLFQLGLRAVYYSKPARYTLQSHLRIAFRLYPPNAWDPKRIHNTCQFLYNAANATSLEHRVLRTLLMVWHYDLNNGSCPGASKGKDLRILSGFERERRIRDRQRMAEKYKRMQKSEKQIFAGRMDHFRMLVKLLNESMGLCLR